MSVSVARVMINGKSNDDAKGAQSAVETKKIGLATLVGRVFGESCRSSNMSVGKSPSLRGRSYNTRRDRKEELQKRGLSALKK